jgi:hypothetical protein
MQAVSPQRAHGKPLRREVRRAATFHTPPHSTCDHPHSRSPRNAVVFQRRK